MISTKIGRLLKPTTADKRTGIGKFFERSLPPGGLRLFLRRRHALAGILAGAARHRQHRRLFAHDVDVFTHGSKEASDQRIGEFMQGGYHALVKLREEGAVKAIGAGINEWQVAETLARAGDFDLFLLAGRYTLLEQEALTASCPIAREEDRHRARRALSIPAFSPPVPKPGAYYNYAPALARHSRPRRAASRRSARRTASSWRRPRCVFRSAIRRSSRSFPGGQAPQEVTRNAEIMGAKIPAALWSDLKGEGLLREDAPVPK